MTVHKTKRTHQPLEIDDNVKRSRQEPCSKSRGVKKQSRGPLLKNLVPKVSGKDNNKESLAEENVGREGRLKGALCIEPVLEQESQSIEINDQKERPTASKKAENLGRTPPWLTTKKPLPAVPEMCTDGQMDISYMHNYLINLYEYNVRLREDFLAAQSVLGDIVQRLSPHSDVAESKYFHGV
eukprot:Gb_36268 [translate_table: standard]